MTAISPRLKQLDLLYVDDDEEMWRLLERSLKRHFRHIFYARNGREGLESLERHNPDVIVTDIEMPVLDGLEMIEEAHRLPGFDTPILVVTAFNDEEHRSRFALDHIIKPVRIPQLLERIDELAARA